MMTEAPAAASTRQVFSPMPLAPPVTSARRPSNRNGCISRIVTCGTTGHGAQRNFAKRTVPSAELDTSRVHAIVWRLPSENHQRNKTMSEGSKIRQDGALDFL